MSTSIKPGQHFGRWTVLSLLPERYSGQLLWLCRCECGTIRAVCSHSLTAGRSLSCGCMIADNNRAREIDLTGKRFGRLVVTGKAIRNGFWRCVCDCGNVVDASGATLRSGNTASCGCLRAERISAMEAERELGYSVHADDLVDGTDLSSISPSRRLNRNSKTGVKGVSLCPDGRYRVSIVLRRHQYHLGVYSSLDEAREARLRAEKELYIPILEAHQRSKRSK